MEIFTYGDYIKSIHTVRLHSMMSFMEEGVNYKINKTNEKVENEKYSKKAIQDMIKDREQASLLLTKNLQFDFEVSRNSLQTWNKKISKRIGTKLPDSIFKIKDKEIYILMEYKENEKDDMYYTMLNYSIELMQKIVKQNTNFKNNAQIIPVVVQKNKGQKINEEQKIENEYFYNKKEFQYNVINI